MINLLADFRSPELAIDLGTAETRVASRGGEVRVQPSLSGDRRAVAGGVVVDTDATVALLEPMLWQSRRFGRCHPRAVACTPTDVTAQEREALADCVFKAGAQSVSLIPEPVAAAVGAGIDIGSGRPIFMVDMGDGVTDCAVIQRGKVVQSVAVRVGCSNLRRRIKQFVSQFAHLELCASEAERLLRVIGFEGTASGKVACTGIRRMRVHQEKLPRRGLQDAVRPAIGSIVGAICSLLCDLPASLAVQIIEDGMYLSGGGALLHGIREHVAEATHVDVHLVKNPRSAVVRGAREMIPFVGELAVVRR